MERHEILEAMTELKLYGMRASFDEIAGKGLTRRDEIYPLIASLITSENATRDPAQQRIILLIAERDARQLPAGNFFDALQRFF